MLFLQENLFHTSYDFYKKNSRYETLNIFRNGVISQEKIEISEDPKA